MHRKHLDIAFDIKALDESGAFEGYASVFDVVDGFDDRVAPGAFAASLAASRGGRGVKMLWQHDAAEPIGAWDAITEDARGLYVRGRLLLDVRRGAEAHALLKAGAIDGLSIGYTTVEATYDANKRSRRLSEIALWEISLVTFQACPGAEVVAVKGETPQTIRAFERFLRDVGGYSHSDAGALAHGGFKALARRDAASGTAGLVASLHRASAILKTNQF
ncbi:MAG: HK97 family phage prohead protease [Alphaproteobacteria bacterium]|jgi:HK97 family phage prohead protease